MMMREKSESQRRLGFSTDVVPRLINHTNSFACQLAHPFCLFLLLLLVFFPQLCLQLKTIRKRDSQQPGLGHWLHSRAKVERDREREFFDNVWTRYLHLACCINFDWERIIRRREFGENIISPRYISNRTNANEVTFVFPHVCKPTKRSFLSAAMIIHKISEKEIDRRARYDDRQTFRLERIIGGPRDCQLDKSNKV